jgi:hypothetical protein
LQLVYRLAFTLCACFAFGAAVTACNSGNVSLTASPTPSYTPGPITASPAVFSLSVSQANTQNLYFAQSPGSPANGIGTPNPLWPATTDTCTNVYTVNGPVQNQSTSYMNGPTTSAVTVTNIKGIKVGSCMYVVTDGSGDGISSTVTVTVTQ